MSRRAKHKNKPVNSTAQPSVSNSSNSRWASLGVCVFLTAIIWTVFGPALHYEFVNFDDGPYVYENPEVTSGLTFRGIAWAFTYIHSYNWHPLTWISHMLDCQLFGLNPAGHHFTNILLHAATAILLFLVLRQMTGFLWRSAFVAALFAIHPLRVESVAWVAERKDVLSGVFFMLTIGAYVRYVRRPWSLANYGLVVLLFALGLMCKPMLVTLPIILLLLDYWPLKRLQAEPNRRMIKRLILEKLPLLALSGASCVVTLFAQTQAIRPADQVSLPARLGNALISSTIYVEQMFWPSRLVALYPFPARGGSIWAAILAVILLLSISACVFALRKKHPYLLAGWFWYLVMLAPVIGILQVGLQAHADRYTYLPQIGLYVLLVWSVSDLSAIQAQRRLVPGGCSAIILVALILCARNQVSYWRNSESLWTRAIAFTSDNFIAHSNLGVALAKTGKTDDAIAQYQHALKIKPDYAEARSNLGSAFLQKGNVDGAMGELAKALQLNPDNAEAQNNLGNALLQKGNAEEAMVHLEKSLQLNPNNAEAHNNLGSLLLQKGNVDEAISHFQQTLRLKPDAKEAHYNLGNALLEKGRADEAIDHYHKALQIDPGYLDAQNNLALVLATAPQKGLRDGSRAITLAQRANQAAGGQNPFVLRTLAAAYAEAGQFTNAIQSAQKAIELARAVGRDDLSTQLNFELKLYEAGLPFHQNSK